MISLGRTTSTLVLSSIFLLGLGMLPYSEAADFQIVVKPGSMMFTPQEVKIKAGDSVVWVNHDGKTHWLTSVGPSSLGTVIGAENLFIYSLILPDEIYRHAFTEADTYYYYCPIHDAMWGTVIVEK